MRARHTERTPGTIARIARRILPFVDPSDLASDLHDAVIYAIETRCNDIPRNDVFDLADDVTLYILEHHG